MRHSLLVVIPTPQVSTRLGIVRLRAPATGQIVAVELMTDEANPVASSTIDVNVGATVGALASIFGDQAKRPAIAPGTLLGVGGSGAGGLPVAVSKRQLIYVDLDVAALGGTGAPLYVLIEIEDGVNTYGAVSVVTAVIAAGASLNISAPLGKAFILSKVATDVAARVRVYSSPDWRTADASRSSGTLPSQFYAGGEHGVIADVSTEGLDLSKDTPANAIGVNKEAIRTADTPLAVTNLSGVGAAITITFERLLLEA